jgi:hypothetical protein
MESDPNVKAAKETDLVKIKMPSLFIPFQTPYHVCMPN